jgi:ABC-type sugar transport system permease subunit
VLIAIIGSLQTYQLVYVLTGDRPTTSVLALEVFTQAFGHADQGYASAISMVQFVIVAVIALTALAILRRRETQL